MYVYPDGGSVDGVAGDHCMVAPPLTTSVDSIDRIAAVLRDAIAQVAADVGYS